MTLTHHRSSTSGSQLTPAFAANMAADMSDMASVLAMTERNQDPAVPSANPDRATKPPLGRRLLDALLRRGRYRRAQFILEVETDAGWQRVTFFRRPDEARAQLRPVAGLMPHLRLRISKEMSGEIKALKRYQVFALVAKIVCLGLVAALAIVLLIAWILG